jgi:hypothetical protein
VRDGAQYVTQLRKTLRRRRKKTHLGLSPEGLHRLACRMLKRSRMSRKTEKVKGIVRRERQRMLDSITRQCKPLIQAEFNRLRRQYPDFRAILFGNGTYFFDFREGSRYERRHLRDETPKAFEDLHDMCAEFEGYMDDITDDAARA